MTEQLPIVSCANKSRLLMFPVIGILFCILIIAEIFINADALVLALWILFCLTIICLDLRFFLKYVIYFYSYSTNVLAIFIIENKSFYLPELDCNTQRYGALLLITITHCIFIMTLYYTDHTTERILNNNLRISDGTYKGVVDTRILLALSTLFTFINAYMLYNVLKTTAASVQLDRFMYAEQFIGGLWRVMNTWAIYFMPIMVILAYRKKYVAAFVPTFMYCFYMKLAGHKFGVFLTVIAFFLPFIIEKCNLKKFNFNSLKSLIPLTLLTVIGLEKTLYSFMSSTYQSSKSDFYNYIFQRLAQQGQMWWAIYGYEKNAGLHLGELVKSSGVLFGIDKTILDSKDFGIYKLMKLVTPETIFYKKIASNSRYAFSTDASLYYYFKTTGLIILTVVFALLLVMIVNWYWAEIKSQDWFGALVSGYFYNIILTTLLQSDFEVLLSKKAAFIFAVYLFVNHYRIRIPRKIGVERRAYLSN